MGRLRGCLWLTAGLVVAILAGAIAFIALSRATTQQGAAGGAAGPVVDVVVARQAVAVRAKLTDQDVELKQVPVDAAPEGAVREPGDAIGKVTLVELFPGEIILSQRLVDPNVVSGDGRLALVVSADQVLMAFPAEDLMSKVGVLKPGDHVDILFTLDFPRQATGAAGEGTEKATFDLLQNAVISAIVGAPGATGGTSNVPPALLLTVSPQDALLLKYMKDAGGEFDIVLRAPGAEQPFTADPVDADFVIRRYRIPTGAGQ